MRCSHCGCEDIDIQHVNQIVDKDESKGCLFWLLFGWIYIPFKILFFIPKLIYHFFVIEPHVYENRIVTIYTCKKCGHTWKKYN